MVSRRPLDVQLQLEIERFLYLEARLLDDQEFDRWRALYAEDPRYGVRTGETRLGRRDGGETEPALAVPHTDEDKRGLRDRVQRLQSGLPHAEPPPSRTRHHISN